MAKSEKLAITDIRTKVSLEPDYIFSRRHGNSLKFYLSVEQGTEPSYEKIAKMLGLSPEEFAKERITAFEALKLLLDR